MNVIGVRHGSVKDLEVFEEATHESLGMADMVFRPRYSIFDLKKMPDEIPGREAICTMAAYNFELLENNGVRTHYLGVVNRDGNVVMDSDLIRRFLEILERKFQSERPYEFKHGLRMENGKSMCQEITIAKIAIQKLADFCIGKQTIFSI